MTGSVSRRSGELCWLERLHRDALWRGDLRCRLGLGLVFLELEQLQLELIHAASRLAGRCPNICRANGLSILCLRPVRAAVAPCTS